MPRCTRRQWQRATVSALLGDQSTRPMLFRATAGRYASERVFASSRVFRIIRGACLGREHRASDCIDLLQMVEVARPAKRPAREQCPISIWTGQPGCFVVHSKSALSCAFPTQGSLLFREESGKKVDHALCNIFWAVGREDARAPRVGESTVLSVFIPSVDVADMSKLLGDLLSRRFLFGEGCNANYLDSRHKAGGLSSPPFFRIDQPSRCRRGCGAEIETSQTELADENARSPG